MRINVLSNRSPKNRSILLLTSVLLWILVLLQGTALASLSIDDEKKLGKEFYDKIEKAGALSKNEQANAFISRLGERILAHSDNAPFEFKFSIIRSAAINAFATPGGYIYVNQGLITQVENEAQLAGVLAHEIAHVNGRHISEIIDKSTAINIASLAAILAGAFLGGSGDAVAAVTTFTLAAGSTLNLKYSREHEEAADRTGMAYLVGAGYNGGAMLEFLRIMRRYEFYSNTIPSYFLTHPGTDERMRYIDALLQTTYTRKDAESILGNLKRVQTLLLLAGRSQASANLQYFQQNLKTNSEDVDALYGLAVTQDRLGMLKESLDTFRSALHLAPEDGDILRDLGIVYYKNGQFDDASSSLSRAMGINKGDTNALLYLGKTSEALGDMPKAISIYKTLEEKPPVDPEVLYLLAMAYGKVNEPGESHYYFGLYFKKKDKADSALFHFKAAQKYFPPDTDRSRDITREIASLQTPKKEALPPAPARKSQIR
jgi:predicted Zn-dependent protease